MRLVLLRTIIVYVTQNNGRKILEREITKQPGEINNRKTTPQVQDHSSNGTNKHTNRTLGEACTISSCKY